MGRMKPRRRQSGAALLLALLIMTLVATLAAGMVWLQWRGIEVETAERARTQAEWLLNASLDWGNLILKSSIRNSHTEDDLVRVQQSGNLHGNFFTSFGRTWNQGHLGHVCRHGDADAAQRHDPLGYAVHQFVLLAEMFIE